MKLNESCLFSLWYCLLGYMLCTIAYAAPTSDVAGEQLGTHGTIPQSDKMVVVHLAEPQKYINKRLT